MDRIPDDLASLTVMDLEDRVVRFGALFAERAAVLVFLRHFG
jgi:hypothetical protein